MLEASQNLPEGSGTIEKVGDQWIFNSPESVIVGKDVPVTLDTLTIDSVEHKAIVVDGQWPLFIQNEVGEWEKTGIEYVDVTKPLVDTDGNPIALRFEMSDTDLMGFFVRVGDPFIEEGIEYQLVGVSLDGNPEGGLMTTNVMLPLETVWLNTAPRAYAATTFYELKNGVYERKSVSGVHVKDRFSWNMLNQGEVFYADLYVDNSGFEAELENRRVAATSLLLIVSNMLWQTEKVLLDYSGVLLIDISIL